MPLKYGAPDMRPWIVRLLIIALSLAFLPRETPAPLVYRPGEGWTYEPVGGGKWTRDRAEDQLQVAQEALDGKEYRIAIKAGRRTVRMWPLSDFAPKAQFVIGRAYELRGNDEKAFKEYQKLVEKYPKVENFDEVLLRQYEIAQRFLEGQWFKLWGVIPFFPSMGKTADMLETVIKNGPYSEIAPEAQMSVGAAREKQEDYSQAVKAYQRAADLYHDQNAVAAEAIYKAAMAYNKQANTADYDQSAAQKAIDTFADFIALYPSDPRVGEARQTIAALKDERARGSLRIGRFYEKRGELDGALVYYSDVVNILRDPNSEIVQEVNQRIEAVKRRRAEQLAAKSE